jgi:pyruvate/2-oxoglutarate dehydrogenase complex dihydrolipoamide dehydrogenase (E3) component
MTERFDAIIIGTGQSGPALARALADAGRKVAVVERKDFGGSCINHGCIPTKAYVASARAAHVARNAADWGVRVEGQVRVDLRAVKARKDKLVSESSGGVEKSLRRHENVTVIQGHARFVGPRRLRVGEQELGAEVVVLNTGARARVPDIPGLAELPWLSATDLLQLEELPAHLLIVGGGYIGLEFGQMFRRFGSDVTIIQRGEQLLPAEDNDISAQVRKILEAEGIRVLTDTAPEAVSGGAGQLRLRIAGQDISGSHLLIATGRAPNIDDLGLAEGGVKTDERGYITVDDQLRTSAQGVLALGDCNGRGAFTHTSYHDYQVACDLLLGEAKRRVSDRIRIYAIYMDPPLGRVGLTEREARESGKPVRMATMPMTRVGRARLHGETAGMMKVLVDGQSERILGAAVLGLHGDEVVQCFADVMYADAPYTVLRDAVHIHPTVAELVPTLLEGLKPLRE